MTLKGLRTNRNLTQKQAAMLLGVDSRTLANWEKGTTYPNVSNIKRIEQVYGMDYDNIDFLPDDSV